jgi:hypothetical protein
LPGKPPPFNLQPSTFQPSTFNLQPSTFNLQPSTFNLQPSTFNLQPSTFNLQPSTFNHRRDTSTEVLSYPLVKRERQAGLVRGFLAPDNGWMRVLGSDWVMAVGNDEMICWAS